MSAAIDNLYAGLGEAGADGAEELLGDECVSAAANYENRARERTDWRVHPSAPSFQTSTYRATTSGNADAPIWASRSSCCSLSSGRELGSGDALRLEITTEGAKRRDRLVGQPRATERNGREQHQAVDPFGVIGGDQFGDLGSEALADDDHRSVDTGQDLAGLGGKRFEREVSRIGDGSNARAEPRQVIAHGVDFACERGDHAVPYCRVIEESMDEQQLWAHR